MIMDDLRVLFLGYMVQGALLGYVGMGLIGIRLNLKQFVTVGVFQGLVGWLVRGVYTINEIPFGTHVFFNLISLSIILYYVVYKRLDIATLGSLLGNIIGILGESLLLPRVLNYINMTSRQVRSDIWLHIFIGHLGDWLLILVALILWVSKRSFIRVNDLKD